MSAETREFKVAFTGAALEQFRQMNPSLPPGDELFVRVTLGECRVCGLDMTQSTEGAMDVIAVTDEGELIGEFICPRCGGEEYEGPSQD